MIIYMYSVSIRNLHSLVAVLHVQSTALCFRLSDVVQLIVSEMAPKVVAVVRILRVSLSGDYRDRNYNDDGDYNSNNR